MDAYDDQGGDEYYVDDHAGSFEHDLVYALDAGVTETPELDPTLVTYLNKFSKDLMKGIDRAWRKGQLFRASGIAFYNLVAKKVKDPPPLLALYIRSV
ncbi:hypothetical protein NDU88_005822 [Pleurodeles waltl]|uniref:Uncharacterized protein n=1 Tax=Pleurodeles waltl TaxID=8319 RepID=A0AAV7PJZ1_PLEWA|nr:hypothetical protein NDU88_005822 [Pleurodeles waltl]